MSEIKGQEKISGVLERFMMNNYTREDLNEIITWFKQSPPDDNLKLVLFQLWDRNDTQSCDAESFDPKRILDSIHHRINTAMKSAPAQKSIVARSFRVFSRIAAILILPLLATVIYYNYTGKDSRSPEQGKPLYSEVFAPPGSRLHLELPDGSDIWLNNGSSIRYPQQFGTVNREIYLSGEAYLDVKHDRLMPFVLKVPGLDIKVAGTSFNVMAYHDDQQVEVALEKGKIELIGTGTDTTQKIRQVLKPGNFAVYNNTKRNLTIAHGPVDQYSAWKDGRLVFDNDSMTVIEKRLERWFNVDIEVADVNLKNTTFTATFTTETLLQVLEMLSLAAPIRYEIINGIKKPDHTFSQTRIIMMFDKNKT